MSHLLQRLKKSSEHNTQQHARNNKPQDSWWIEGIDKTIRITSKKSSEKPVRWQLVLVAVNLFWLMVVIGLFFYFRSDHQYARSQGTPLSSPVFLPQERTEQPLAQDVSSVKPDRDHVSTSTSGSASSSTSGNTILLASSSATNATADENFFEEKIPDAKIVNHELAMVELMDEYSDEKEQIVVQGNQIMLHKDAQQKSFTAPEQSAGKQSTTASQAPVMGRLVDNLRKNYTTSQKKTPAKSSATIPSETTVASAKKSPQKTVPSVTHSATDSVPTSSFLATLDRDWRRLPTVEELEPALTAALPELHFSTHAYVPDDPMAREVTINGRLLREGEQIADQLYLRQVTISGAVLEFRKQRFYVDLR